MKGSTSRIAVPGWFFAAALSAGALHAEADRLGPALEKRIKGQAALDDVRVEVAWARGGPMSSARVYGDGVGIWNRRLQFRLSKPQVLAILKALRQAKFGAMPDAFGEEEEGEETAVHEGPRMKGRIDARAGSVSKSVIQMMDGEQSQPLAALAQKLLALCEEPARAGVGAESLADGLRKTAAGALAPETFSATVQRRFERPDPTGQTAWILTLEGRVAVSESLPAGRTSAPRMELTVSESDFRNLAGLLDSDRAADIPLNVHAPEYTDVQLAVLGFSRTISARRFLSMTADTHGEAQKSFDRIYDAFRALNARVRQDGKPLPPRPDAEREREREEEREKREKD